MQLDYLATALAALHSWVTGLDQRVAELEARLKEIDNNSPEQTYKRAWRRKRKILALQAEGKTVDEIAELCGVSKGRIYGLLAEIKRESPEEIEKERRADESWREFWEKNPPPSSRKVWT